MKDSTVCASAQRVRKKRCNLLLAADSKRSSTQSTSTQRILRLNTRGLAQILHAIAAVSDYGARVGRCDKTVPQNMSLLILYLYKQTKPTFPTPRKCITLDGGKEQRSRKRCSKGILFDFPSENHLQIRYTLAHPLYITYTVVNFLREW